ncbi:hypothetical protein [Vagococcus silagei]|uniref:DUF819 family protein n=1 Tax=Vagococcus silagei TaxID=2508885 RepID=A0A4S3B4M9_9ENTE|nr:hypothetical protein [Vagococcus silagei]THB60366.1 hypothetical protein ESZ54_11000 [Vagococcus silagei]
MDLWTPAFCFAVVAFAMLAGEIVSSKTKGTVPQMLIVAIIFLIGFWTIFPKDILDIGHITPISQVVISFILIHVGTMFDIKSIKQEWKVVVVVLCAIVGIVAITIGVGTIFFGKEIGFTAAAPMTGGGMAALVMDQAARAAGKPELGILAMMIFIMHGFFGFPITAFILKKECQRLLVGFRANDQEVVTSAVKEDKEEKETPKKLIDRIPKQYQTPLFYIAQLALWATVAIILEELTGVNNAIIQVLLGITLSHFGLISTSPLVKSESGGILTMALLASFMGSFAFATPKMIATNALQIVVLMTVATIAIFICTVPIGKKLGYSSYMSIAIGLNCFLGFPFNYALTNEAIKGATNNEAEAAYLNSQLMSKMIIAGIVSVSIVSAVLAGIIAGAIF